MAEWFDVGASLQQSGSSKGGYISGSDTEEDPESDNEDVDPEATFEDEDWEKVEQDSGKSQEESKVTIVLAAIPAVLDLINCLRGTLPRRAWVKMTTLWPTTKSVSSNTCKDDIRLPYCSGLTGTLLRYSGAYTSTRQATLGSME